MSILYIVYFVVHSLTPPKTDTHSFWRAHPRCGLWLSQLSRGVLWSIGVEGFCFLLLCQVPSQRLLISVNLSCATTFSFPLPLSPISLTFPLSLTISSSLCLPPVDLFTLRLLLNTFPKRRCRSLRRHSRRVQLCPSASHSRESYLSHGCRGSSALAQWVVCRNLDTDN